VGPGVDHDHGWALKLDVLRELIDVVTNRDHLAAKIVEGSGR
jgi:hypothetical protein